MVSFVMEIRVSQRLCHRECLATFLIICSLVLLNIDHRGDKILVRCKLACSRLRDSGEKSFSKMKCEKRAGAGERLIFALLVF